MSQKSKRKKPTYDARSLRPLVISYGFLLISILLEIVGVALLKGALPSPLAYLYMLVPISLSYICLSLSLRRINIGVAYAMWEVVGSVLIIAMSILLFHESVSTRQAIGLGFAMCGIVCVTIDEIGRS